MALGMQKKTLRALLFKELSLITASASFLGLLCAAPVSYLIWKLFELFIISNAQMTYRFGVSGFLPGILFTLALAVMLGIAAGRFIRRSDLMDILRTRQKTEMIKEINPEAVILAVGSDDLILPIEGIENAVTAMEVYNNDFKGLGESTIILGGGLVGCEAAADYIDHGVKTTIVEMKAALMPDITGLYRTAVHDFIDEHGGKYEVNARVTKVGKDFVTAEQDGKEITLKADTVVNAMGRRNHSTEALEAVINEKDILVWKIGDCVHARQIGDSVREAWTAAMEII